MWKSALWLFDYESWLSLQIKLEKRKIDKIREGLELLPNYYRGGEPRIREAEAKIALYMVQFEIQKKKLDDAANWG